MKVKTPPCMQCGEASELEVDEAKYSAWQTDTKIQHAFPDWSADQRELLMTGTHPKCWDELFKGGEGD